MRKILKQYPFQCACGKYNKISQRGSICDKCKTEVRIRQYYANDGMYEEWEVINTFDI